MLVVLLLPFRNTAVKRLRMRELSGEEVEEHQLMMMIVHCEHCCLLCFLALVLDCDNNSCEDIQLEYRCRHVYEAPEKRLNKITRG